MTKTKEYDAGTGKVIDPERRKAVMLLADANDSEVLTSVLREKRFRILGMTGKPDAAFELMRKHKVGILFLDESIPGMDLSETLFQIKRRFPEFMIVLLGEHVSREELQELFSRGVEAFLVKPLQYDAIVTSMSRFKLG
ncbi:MAG: response regulator [Gammaproteobacteria bacterium]|nr:response regulator [Gammaproteobacteria bacterium]MDH5653767.1 response regulator [Gammaproteobacteria bacterium]